MECAKCVMGKLDIKFTDDDLKDKAKQLKLWEQVSANKGRSDALVKCGAPEDKAKELSSASASTKPAGGEEEAVVAEAAEQGTSEQKPQGGEEEKPDAPAAPKPDDKPQPTPPSDECKGVTPQSSFDKLLKCGQCVVQTMQIESSGNEIEDYMKALSDTDKAVDAIATCGGDKAKAKEHVLQVQKKLNKLAVESEEEEDDDAIDQNACAGADKLQTHDEQKACARCVLKQMNFPEKSFKKDKDLEKLQEVAFKNNQDGVFKAMQKCGAKTEDIPAYKKNQKDKKKKRKGSGGKNTSKKQQKLAADEQVESVGF